MNFSHQWDSNDLVHIFHSLGVNDADQDGLLRTVTVYKDKKRVRPLRKNMDRILEDFDFEKKSMTPVDPMEYKLGNW